MIFWYVATALADPSWSDESFPVDPMTLPGAEDGWWLLALAIAIAIPAAALFGDLRPGAITSALRRLGRRQVSLSVALRGEKAVRVRVIGMDPFELFPGDPVRVVKLAAGVVQVQVDAIEGDDGPICMLTVETAATIEVSGDGSVRTLNGSTGLT